MPKASVLTLSLELSLTFLVVFPWKTNASCTGSGGAAKSFNLTKVSSATRPRSSTLRFHDICMFARRIRNAPEIHINTQLLHNISYNCDVAYFVCILYASLKNAKDLFLEVSPSSDWCRLPTRLLWWLGRLEGLHQKSWYRWQTDFKGVPNQMRSCVNVCVRVCQHRSSDCFFNVHISIVWKPSWIATDVSLGWIK